MREPAPGACGPVVFLHVPKTGGTSLIEAIFAPLSEHRRVTDAGNISLDLLHRRSADLTSDAVVYGHALHGVLGALTGARMATVLRRPVDQFVSNYLFIRRTRDTPLHRRALDMHFDDFVRANWQLLVFQAISLDVAQSSSPISTRVEFFRRLQDIQALLDRIDHVGVLDRLDEFLGRLSAAIGQPPPERTPRVNLASDAGVDQDEVRDLQERYQALWNDPGLAPLLAAEAGLYGRAARIAEAQARGFAAAPPAEEGPASGIVRRMLSRLRRSA